MVHGINPGGLQPIGVKAIWDGSQFDKGFEKYIRYLTIASAATRQNTASIVLSWKRFEQSFASTMNGVVSTLQKIETNTANTARSSQAMLEGMQRGFKVVGTGMTRTTNVVQHEGRKWIASISGVVAAFRLLPQVVEQFTQAMREAVGGTAMRQAFANLTLASQTAADDLLSEMKRASKGTVNEMELIRAANRAIMIGGQEFAKEVPRLLEISRAAAIATGKDINWVFQTLTQGIARSSAKLIDNAEIYLRLGPVVKKYAEAQGKTVDELDATMRQMIILNAVLDQGGDLIYAVGSDMEVATDKFDRARAYVDDLRESFLQFTSQALGPMSPVLAEAARLFNQIAPALQTIALLKLANVGLGLEAIGAGLASIVASTGVGALLIAVGAAIYGLQELVFEPKGYGFLEGIGEALETASKWADIAQYRLRKWFGGGKEAADEWFRGVTGLTTATMEADRALSDYNKTIGANADAYRLYLGMVQKLNAELPKGAKKIEHMTGPEFTASQIGKVLEEQAAAQERAEERAMEARQRMLKMYMETAAKAGREQEKTAEEIRKLEQELAEDTEEIATKHAEKMVDIAEDAAKDRADAWLKYLRDIQKAELTRNRAIEDATRRHKFALEDIEYDYRRRILEIEEQYQATVFEAAISRDALAIIRARRRKQEQLTDATRDRQDAIRTETRSYQESLYLAQRAYQDRMAAIRQSLQDELAEIERNLAEQTRKEKAAYKEREDNLRDSLQEELRILKEEYAKQERERLRFIRYMNSLRLRSSPGSLPRYYDPDTGTVEYDEGFEGIVQGPKTVKIGAGVTEYIYASGDLNKRQRVMPSPAANQMQGMRAMVSGGVNVGLGGFSNALVQRISASLTQTVGQAVMDEMADALMGV